MAVETDRIEKTTTLGAPIERVWQAITDARQFGAWFGAEFDGVFVPGGRLTGRIMPTQVDGEVAKMQEPYAGKPFVVFVEQIERRAEAFASNAEGWAHQLSLIGKYLARH